MKQMLFKELVGGILSIFGYQVIRIVSVSYTHLKRPMTGEMNWNA